MLSCDLAPRGSLNARTCPKRHLHTESTYRCCSDLQALISLQRLLNLYWGVTAAPVESAVTPSGLVAARQLRHASHLTPCVIVYCLLKRSIPACTCVLHRASAWQAVGSVSSARSYV